MTAPEGNNSYSAATAPNAGNFSTGPAKHKANAAFQFATTNAVTMNDSDFSTSANRDDVNGLRYAYPLGGATSRAAPAATAADSYEEAKERLQQKQRMHSLLTAKLEAEKLDLSLPKNSMVQLVDAAQPAQSQNAWQRLTGEFESKARIKVENDVNDIVGFSGSPTAAAGAYDPYFVQTTSEIIRSDTVLGKVVDTLKLDDAWTKKDGREKLTKKEAISLLKKRLDLNPVKNTKLIEIGATSDNPNEAADIANAVAKAYGDYRFENRGQLVTNGLAALEEQFAQQEQIGRAHV